MTLTYGFYNSVSSDRVYNALQMSRIFDGIIMDGVFASIGDKLLVVPNSGLQVAVGSGRAWFDHTWSYNDADVLITIDSPHATYPRIDIIALEVNSEEAVRANSFKYVKGTAASTPQPPTLTNTSTIHQYPLAYISVPVGLSTILQSHITNKVGTSLCPFVTGPLSVITTNELLLQWESEFMQWFEDMKDQLTEDAAGALQLQIDALEDGLAAHDHVGGDGATLLPAAIQDRTRTLLLPVSEENAFFPNDSILGFNFRLKVPEDYFSSGKLYGIVASLSGSGNIKIKISGQFGSVGESFLQHTFDTGILTLSIPTTVIYKLASQTLTSLTKNDYLSCGFQRYGNDANDTYNGALYCLGVLFEYVADS